MTIHLVSSKSDDLQGTIHECYSKDPSIQAFSRNSEHGLEGRVKLEVEAANDVHESFKFYRIYDNETLVGYFGTEEQPVNCLTTFFIMPEYRDRKDQVWNFIVSHLNGTFYAGLFKVNARAIKFFEKMGGKQVGETIAEGKPSVVFQFER